MKTDNTWQMSSHIYCPCTGAYAGWQYEILQYFGMHVTSSLVVLRSLMVDALDTDVWGLRILHVLQKVNARWRQFKLQDGEHLP